MEEPWPKKLKTDNQLRSTEEQQQLLKKLYYLDKKSPKKPLSFHEVSWEFGQNDLELQERNSTDFKTNLRQYPQFRPCMNANLQSRLLGNIPFIEKWALENKCCSNLKYSSSEFSENNNSLVPKPKPWTLHAKKREKSRKSGNFSKDIELPTVNTFFNNVAENLIARIESLLTDMLEFQSNENCTGCHQVHGEQNHIPKPLADGENINDKTPHVCWPASNFMKETNSDLGTFVDEDRNILYCKKQIKCCVNNNLRRNKVYKHMYIPCSRNCGVVSPKLVKCAAFDYSIAVEKNDTSRFSQIILLNAQQREISNDLSAKECFLFSRDAIQDGTFSLVGNEKEQMARQLVLSNNRIFPANNFHTSSLWGKRLYKPTMHNLIANIRVLNCLTSAPSIFGRLGIKKSNNQMVVTMDTYIQKKNKKLFNENVFPVKKFKAHFILRAHNKQATGRSRNNHFRSKSKYVPEYVGTCSRATLDKMRNGNCEDCQENPCRFAEMKANLNPFDTYKKICLCTDSEEVDEILSVGNVIFNTENNENYSKRCTIPDKIITCRDSDTLSYNFVLPELFTNYNSLLELNSKSKKPHFPKDINTNNQRPKCPVNKVHFPMCLNSENILKYFSFVDQYFTSAISCDPSVYQNIPISVKMWHSKISLNGKREKQNGFVFEKYQPICSSRVLKHPKVKKAENVNFLLQKSILLNSTHNPELVSVKQNAEGVNKIENATVGQLYTNKGNEHQDLTVSQFSYECGESADSQDNLTVTSCTMIQDNFEDAIEEHFSSEIKKRYKFEMKNQFDLVLEELHMFNEISKENENTLLCRQRNFREKFSLVVNHSDSILNEDSGNIGENKVNAAFLTTGTTINNTAVNHTTMVKQTKNEQNLIKNTMLKSPGEQEVPHDYYSSSILDEEMFSSPSQEHCEFHCKQPFPWCSAFVSHTFLKERSYNLRTETGKCLLDGIIRVQPLKTCRGPLRVGLSRKAKPKQLHPYLK